MDLKDILDFNIAIWISVMFLHCISFRKQVILNFDILYNALWNFQIQDHFLSSCFWGWQKYPFCSQIMDTATEALRLKYLLFCVSVLDPLTHSSWSLKLAPTFRATSKVCHSLKPVTHFTVHSNASDNGRKNKNLRQACTDLRNTAQKIKKWATRTPQTVGELMCSRRVAVAALLVVPVVTL
jgi:hypothetical protein